MMWLPAAVVGRSRTVGRREVAKLFSRLKRGSVHQLFDPEFTPQVGVGDCPLMIQLSGSYGPNSVPYFMPYLILDECRRRSRSRSTDQDVRDLASSPMGLIVIMGADGGDFLRRDLDRGTVPHVLREVRRILIPVAAELGGRFVNGDFDHGKPLWLARQTVQRWLIELGVSHSAEAWSWHTSASWDWVIDRTLEGAPPTEEELRAFHGGQRPAQPMTSPNEYVPASLQWERDQ